jgi:Icc protein
MPFSRNSHNPNKTLAAQKLPPGTVRALQLTDTHLYADDDGTLLGINTLQSLQRVIGHVRDNWWPIDLLLATGDLVHDSSPAGYARIQAMLDGFDVPAFCLPGNHDDPDMLRRHLTGGHVSTDRVCDHGNWRFVMLDSVVPGEEGGRLSRPELDALDQALAATDRHVLVCMHHQPVAVGSAWIDTMAIDNPDALFAIVDRHPNVRGMLWGHIHQTFEGVRNGVRLMASPSTCVQFTPNVEDFQVDEEPPGFRLLAMLPDGSIRSEVTRIQELPRGLELASSGY